MATIGLQLISPFSRRFLPYLLIAALAVTIVASAGEPLLPLALALALGVLLITWLDQRLLAPLIILALPLEVSKNLFPFLESATKWGAFGTELSIIDLGRLGMLLALGLRLINARRDWLATLPRSGLILPLLVLLALSTVSLTYSLDRSSGLADAVLFTFYLAFALILPFFIDDRSTMRLCLWTLALSGLALALIGIYQRMTGSYLFWGDTIKLEPGARVNATFADPNHFARFLNIAIVAAAVLFFTNQHYRNRLLLIATAGICFLTLILTGSRSGWLIGAIIFPSVLFFLPISPKYKVSLASMGGLGIIAVVVALSAFDNFFAERFETVELGLQAIGARYYLIQAGWRMFLDNPLEGLGSGSFQEAILGPYKRFIWSGYTTTLSHTSIITIAAELGALGLTAVAFLVYRLFNMLARLYRSTDSEAKLMITGIGAMFFIVFLGSQSEGRLFEDPYLWLIFGLIMAMEAIAAKPLLLSPARHDSGPAGYDPGLQPTFSGEPGEPLQEPSPD